MCFASPWDKCLCNKVPFFYLLNGCWQSTCTETNIQIYAEVSEDKNHLDSKVQHTVIYVGGNLRKSLVQPPLPSRVSCESRPGCSELCPIGSWKSPGTETAQSPWASCAPAWTYSGWKCFLYPVWTSLVSTHACCLSSNHHGPLWKAQLHLLPHLPMGSCSHLPSCWGALLASSLSHCSRLAHPRSRKLYLFLNFTTFLLAHSPSLPRS